MTSKLTSQDLLFVNGTTNGFIGATTTTTTTAENVSPRSKSMDGKKLSTTTTTTIVKSDYTDQISSLQTGVDNNNIGLNHAVSIVKVLLLLSLSLFVVVIVIVSGSCHNLLSTQDEYIQIIIIIIVLLI